MSIYVYEVSKELESGAVEPASKFQLSPSAILDQANQRLVKPLLVERFTPTFGLCTPTGRIAKLELDDISMGPDLRFHFRSDVVKRPGKKMIRKLIADRVAELEFGGKEGGDEGYDADEDLVLDHYEKTATPTSTYGCAYISSWRSGCEGFDNATVVVISAPDVAFADDMMTKLIQFVWGDSVSAFPLFPGNVQQADAGKREFYYHKRYLPPVLLGDLVRVTYAATKSGLDGYLGVMGTRRISLFFDNQIVFKRNLDEEEDDELAETIKVKANDPSVSDVFEDLIDNPHFSATAAEFQFVFESADDESRQIAIGFSPEMSDKKLGGLKSKQPENELRGSLFSLSSIGFRLVNMLYLGLEAVRGVDVGRIFDFDAVAEASDNEEEANDWEEDADG